MGSSNTRAASEKRTSCFPTLLADFSGSQTRATSSVYKDMYTAAIPDARRRQASACVLNQPGVPRVGTRHARVRTPHRHRDGYRPTDFLRLLQAFHLPWRLLSWLGFG